VATGWSAFRDYQQTEAWVWEHLALTRARVIAGPKDLTEDVEGFRAALLAEKGKVEGVIREAAAMRARVADAKRPEGPWDPKLGSGRLQEIELIAQAGSLMAGETQRSVAAGVAAGVAIGWLDDAGGHALLRAYGLFWRVLQASKLLSDRPLDPGRIGEGGTGFVLRETGHETLADLQADLEAAAHEAAQVIDRALSEPSGEK